MRDTTERSTIIVLEPNCQRVPRTTPSAPKPNRMESMCAEDISKSGRGTFPWENISFKVLTTRESSVSLLLVAVVVVVVAVAVVAVVRAG